MREFGQQRLFLLPNLELMKKSFLIALAAVITFSVQAQTGKAPVKTTKPLAAKPAGLTLVDSASYAMGVSLASFYKQQGITKINTTLVSKAINDVMQSKKPMMDDAQANSVLTKCMMQIESQKSKPNIDSGMAFLARNKQRAEVHTTASGLQYE